MYRFLLRPKWIAFHLLVVVGIVAMINLGFWQLRRLDQRQEFNAAVESRYDNAPVPLGDALTSTSDGGLDDLEWRPVSASGTYMPDGQVLVVNRSQNGRAGDNIVVPFDLGDGRILLVNRGFVPLGQDAAPVPGGDVDLVGRLRPTQERRLGQLSDPATGELDVAQRVDIDRLAAQLPGEPVPMYIDLIESTPAEPGPYPEPVATPDLSEGNHLSYAVQWFIFALAVAVGWVLAVRKSAGARRDERRVDHSPEASLETAGSEPQPAP